MCELLVVYSDYSKVYSSGTDVEYQATMAPKVLLSHLLFLGYCSKIFLVFMYVTLSLNCYESANTQQNHNSQKTVVNGDCHNLCFEIEMCTLYFLMLYSGLYLCSLSRNQSLLQFVLCRVQVNGAGFAVVLDKKQSIFILLYNL